MTESLKQQLQELINQAAANRFKVHQNMGMHIEFKQGCEFLMPLIDLLIKQRDEYMERNEHPRYWGAISINRNKELLQNLKGEM